LNSQSQESQARAVKYNAEVEAIPAEMELDLMKIASNSLDDSDKDFQRRVEIAKLLLQEEKDNGRKPETITGRNQPVQ